VVYSSYYSGHEKKVCESLKARVAGTPLETAIAQVRRADRNSASRCGGNKRIESSRMFYPGYVPDRNRLRREGAHPDDVFHTIRSTPKVPVVWAVSIRRRLTAKKSNQIVNQQAAGRKAEAEVLVRGWRDCAHQAGPFQSLPGKVEEVNEEKSTLKVPYDLRAFEPVELNFLDVEKVTFTEEE
jgi:transcriptional antiterminator NusG